jgi:murein DD-endopeptidase MepM/ murein hydrolase activator NlpD
MELHNLNNILLTMTISSTSNLLNSEISKELTSITSSSSDKTDSSTFSELLSLMLLSSLSSSSDSSGSSSSLSNMLSPLLMLLEQMQAKSVSSQLDATTSESTGSTSSQTSSLDSNYPVSASLTQGYTSTHHGLDFGVVVGTDVQSTISGKVAYAGWNDQGYGNLVIVDNGTYQTYYAHLSEIPVSVGDTVQKGEVVGLSGNTGNSTGPHLHYEVRKNYTAIDPTTFDNSSL